MAHLTEAHLASLYDEYGELKVLDDIIRHRAGDHPPRPILGYPRSEEGVDDYELITGLDLDNYVDGAVRKFISMGLKPNGRQIVALLAPSNVDFIVSWFGLMRLGYTVFCLSLRIPPAAIIHLLGSTGCNTIVHGQTGPISRSLDAVAEQYASLLCLPIPVRSEYATARPEGTPRFLRQFDRETENAQPALIMHSSGSTGMPKPVILTHKAVLTHATQGAGMNNFGALPWFHMYGISTSLQAMYRGKIANLYNTSLPLTSDNLVAAVQATKPGVVHFVPYALGLLAESPRGVECLKRCKIVTSAGARTPDELGHRLIAEGVNLAVVFGTTEAGLAGDSMRREPGDDTWEYVRFYHYHRPHIYMNSIGGGQYEVVYLKGHPGLTTSNSDHPRPGSWHSKDVFVPHPTIPEAWKYVTRLDDRITLVNGEKILPLDIEGRLREDKLVREAMVVGVDKPVPGLLAFRATASDHLSDEAYLDAIWPSVADANSRSEAFAQITRDMIAVIPSSTIYPQTDKGNIIRAQVYNKFSDEIKQLYSRLDETPEGGLKLNIHELEEFITSAFKSHAGVLIPSVEDDFFSCGVDSLRAIQIRRFIQKSIDVGRNELPSNVVYEHGNVRQLAIYLYSLRCGARLTNGAVILTGATGSLGAHLLHQMLGNDSIARVYCLVRGSNPMDRVIDSLYQRGLQSTKLSRSKIVALVADVSEPDFGLDKATVEEMKQTVSIIIHVAWPVNFNISLASFEPHIRGVHSLLKFSMSVRGPDPAQFFFCSSISSAFDAPAGVHVSNGPITDLSWASPTGYAQSKLVAEHVVLNAAAAGARSRVLRIGQIVGDAQNGIWNDREFIPSMIRSATTLKVLPSTGEDCSWLPVDKLATAILQIAERLSSSSSSKLSGVAQQSQAIVYNMVNPHKFAWTDLLRELKSAGLEFNEVSPTEWIAKLRQSAESSDEERTPAVKLIDYFEEHFGRLGEGPNPKGIEFDASAVQRDSEVLKDPPRMIEDGYIRKFLSQWMVQWNS
ncbi:hypothetical protein N8I77_006562 [Diaporthe amygdali]|uniref:Carrier domain-containing protein n=1 Tax=Phomopsis amygdali TaxID=1214568 RepID=A0AAD9SGY5_PHOAM|nr:hypothetical protein N8I77_006562 [Diaporthe amygdali]